MSSASDDFADFIVDQLAAIRGIVRGRFFGGIGLSASGTQFAMIMGGTLYFVVNDDTRPKYESLGGKCFSYSTKKKTVHVKKYYSVPAAVLEDQDQLIVLARESIRVANSVKR
jgi:DNA transformation protein and related proteins